MEHVIPSGSQATARGTAWHLAISPEHAYLLFLQKILKDLEISVETPPGTCTLQGPNGLSAQGPQKAVGLLFEAHGIEAEVRSRFLGVMNSRPQQLLAHDPGHGSWELDSLLVASRLRRCLFEGCLLKKYPDALLDKCLEAHSKLQGEYCKATGDKPIPSELLKTIMAFYRVEISAGKIVELQDHPEAAQLFVEKVDFGLRARCVVSGLREKVLREDLAGRTCLFATNLKPAVLRGVQSEGMILFATPTSPGREEGASKGSVIYGGRPGDKLLIKGWALDGLCPHLPEIPRCSKKALEEAMAGLSVADGLLFFRGLPLEIASAPAEVPGIQQGTVS